MKKKKRLIIGGFERVTLTRGLKYLSQNGHSLFTLWWVLVAVFSAGAPRTVLLIKSYNPAGLCCCAVSVLSVPVCINCPNSLTCILQPCTHHSSTPALLAQIGRCWDCAPLMSVLPGASAGDPPLPGPLASGRSPALAAAWHAWPLQHVYDLLLLIILNRMQNNSWLSSVCAKIVICDHFCIGTSTLYWLFTRVLSTQRVVGSAQEPSGEFLKGSGFPPRASVNTLNIQTGLGTIFHLGKS